MKTVVLVLTLFASNLFAQGTEHILVHPIFKEYYGCSEHPVGQLQGLGDALGADCSVESFPIENGRQFSRSFKNDGHKNEDWYSWRKDVLAPIDGVVEEININPVTNEPGIMGKGPASYIVITRDDGTSVTVAHVMEIAVEKGQRVQAGQVIAKVGNNGFSSAPHAHIGAFRGQTPLQIRFDLEKMGKLRGQLSLSPSSQR